MTIQALRDLLSDPKRFTVGAFARNASGIPVGPRDEGAVCWCLLGAIRKLETDWQPGSDLYIQLREKLTPRLAGGRSVATWSDVNGHDAVIKLLDEMLEADEVAEVASDWSVVDGDGLDELDDP